MKKSMFYVLLMFVFIFSSCGGGGGSPTQTEPPTAAELCQSGWLKFESGDLAGAKDAFEDALVTDSGFCESYIGLGMTLLREDDFSQAALRFNGAKTKSPDSEQSIDISLGLSFIHVKNNYYEGIFSELEDKITGTDGYVLGHGTGVGAVDIHTLMCEAYIMSRVLGTEGGSAVNAADAWGQLKKALGLDSTDARALELMDYLRGVL